MKKLLHHQKLPGSSLSSKAFLLHELLISQIPISHRRLHLLPRHQDSHACTSEECFLEKVCLEMTNIIDSTSYGKFALHHDLVCDLTDTLDGRLFLKSLELVAAGCQGISSATIEALDVLCKAVGVEYRGESSRYLDSGYADASNGDENLGVLEVLPFSNDVFDKHLGSIKLSVDEQSPGMSSAAIKVFKDLTHWHNSTKRTKTKNNIVYSEKDKKSMRRNQFYVKEMASYAASLTNAIGKSLEPETITTNPRNIATGKSTTMLKVMETSTESSQTKSPVKSKKKVQPPSKKELMLQNIAEQKAVKKDHAIEGIMRAWVTKKTQLDAEASLGARYAASSAYLQALSGPKQEALQNEVMLFQVTILLSIWAAFCKAKKKSEAYDTAALAISILRSLSRNPLTKTEATHALEAATALGAPLSFTSTAKDQKLSFRFRIPSNTEVLGIDWKEFQLLYSGPYLDRNIDSAPDDRVPFEPDGWQRKVLDEIDADNSILVVAPTSAGQQLLFFLILADHTGKTFISFYAMEKILREGNDGVLVYLAPTKALVNQIAAELQARFSKRYPGTGKSVWAVHTRDYRVNNPSGCQILVTVPHVLQIMLLSPENARSWAPKVRRIVFDEIHCIGQAEDGLVWEQLILLAPCPIVALSATIGNAKEFSDWMASTQRSLGNKLTLIQHTHRYSDLRKFEYQAPKDFLFDGLPNRPQFAKLGVDGAPGLSFIHPVVSLTNRSRGIPPDLSLEARDCLSLWKAMCKCQTKQYPMPKSLSPAVALPEMLRKLDIIEWESSLKGLLHKWMLNQDSPFSALLSELEAPSRQLVQPTEVISSGRAVDNDNDEFRELDQQSLEDTTLPLLCSLHHRNALPAILFNYDRAQCESICNAVMQQLETAETEWKDTSPAWKKKVKGWEEWKKVAASKKGNKIPVKKSKVTGEDRDDGVESKQDMMMEAASTEASPFASFDPLAPADGYTFADPKKLPASELEVFFRQLRRKGIDEALLKALHRGIGIHHSGMNRKYRQV